MARKLLTTMVATGVFVVWASPAYADEILCLIHWSQC
jgi:hypothetical protein